MRAYEFFPKNWSGKCGLGHIKLAMRVLPILPAIRITKRDLYTHVQTPWIRFANALIPSYGVIASLEQIRDLSDPVENLANSTSKGMSLLSLYE